MRMGSFRNENKQQANKSDGFTADQQLAAAKKPSRKENHMLWTVAVILIVLWALGLVSSYTMGGFIHILLVLAIIVVLLNVFRGRRV